MMVSGQAAGVLLPCHAIGEKQEMPGVRAEPPWLVIRRQLAIVSSQFSARQGSGVRGRGSGAVGPSSGRGGESWHARGRDCRRKTVSVRDAGGPRIRWGVHRSAQLGRGAEEITRSGKICTAARQILRLVSAIWPVARKLLLVRHETFYFPLLKHGGAGSRAHHSRGGAR